MTKKGEVLLYKRQGNILYLDSVIDLIGHKSVRSVCRTLELKRDMGVRYAQVRWYGRGESAVKLIPEKFDV
jgi:hypothetical protein